MFLMVFRTLLNIKDYLNGKMNKAIKSGYERFSRISIEMKCKIYSSIDELMIKERKKRFRAWYGF